MYSLKNKVAVVTGGNAGIGWATAKEFIQQGAQVILTGRNALAVEKAAAELGGHARGFHADTASLRDTERLVQMVKKEYEQVDILFVNAGVFYPSPIGEITEEHLDTQMGINFRGAVFTIEKFIPLLKKGSSIINLSSVNAHTGMPNTAIYAASKAALNSYTRTAATELAPRGIRVNAINPGPIHTGIFKKTGLTDEMIEGFSSALAARVPLKRFGTPEEVAYLAAFLASDQASYITGAEFNIDGGVLVNPLLAL